MSGRPQRDLFLVSSSPRRRRILKRLGIRYQVVNPEYAEEKLGKLNVNKVVLTYATAKAMSVVKRISEGVLLAADTVVWCHGRVIGKPAGRRDAKRILMSLQGRWHEVYTGVCLLKIRKGRIEKKITFAAKTRVFIRKLSGEAIDRYFKRVNPEDKAGAYAIQSTRASIVEKIRGPLDNAVGLPSSRVLKILKRWNCL